MRHPIGKGAVFNGQKDADGNYLHEPDYEAMAADRAEDRAQDARWSLEP